MDSDRLINCLGLDSDSPEVAALLADLNVKKSPKPARGDVDISLELNKMGISMVFEQRKPKSSAFQLVAVQLFSSAEEGFSEFAGSLPKKLSYTDKRADAHKKLGAPDEAGEDGNEDSWDLDGGLLLTLEYRGTAGAVSMVACDLPED